MAVCDGLSDGPTPDTKSAVSLDPGPLASRLGDRKSSFISHQASGLPSWQPEQIQRVEAETPRPQDAGRGSKGRQSSGTQTPARPDTQGSVPEIT